MFPVITISRLSFSKLSTVVGQGFFGAFCFQPKEGYVGKFETLFETLNAHENFSDNLDHNILIISCAPV